MSKHKLYGLEVLCALILCACAAQPIAETPPAAPIGETQPPATQTQSVAPSAVSTASPAPQPSPLTSKASLRKQIRACCEERFAA